MVPVPEGDPSFSSLFDQASEILPIPILVQFISLFQYILIRNPFLPPCDLLKTGYLIALTSLDNLDKLGSLHHRIVCAGIQPCLAASQNSHSHFSFRKITLLDRRNLQPPPGGRF